MNGKSRPAKKVEVSYVADKGVKPLRPRPHRHVVALLAAGLIAVLGVFAYLSSPFGSDTGSVDGGRNAKPNKSGAITLVAPVEAPKTSLRTFTAVQFQSLYEGLAYPNTTPIAEPPVITGNEAADRHIRNVALSRGYKLRSIPLAPISKIGDPGLGDDDLLQPKALAAWRELQAMAKKDKIPLKILSGYRSPQYQRELFMQRWLAAGGNVNSAAKGGGDAIITQVMTTTAVPGYSRHHTGYTVDLQCDRFPFVATSCFTWISKNNYEKAKTAGWIPSYPDGASAQGPEPEPWEYVWVGKDAVME